MELRQSLFRPIGSRADTRPRPADEEESWFTEHRGWSSFLVILLAVNAGVFLGFCIPDLGRAENTVHSLSVVMRFTLFILNAIAFVGVMKELRGRARNWDLWPWIFAAQLGALPFLFIPILIEARSPFHDRLDALIILISAGLTAGALMVVFFVWVTGRIHFGAAWAFFVALFPLAGLLQFWIQSYYQPAHSRPGVNVNVKMEELSRSGSISRMRGTVTVQNNGKAAVDSLGSLYKAVGYDLKPDKGSMDAAMDVVGPDLNYMAESERILRIGDVLPGEESLTPGQKYETSFVFDADSRKEEVVRLVVNLVLITRGSVKSTTTDCEYEMCAKTLFKRSTAMREILDDDPYAETYIDFHPPGKPNDTSELPYLHIKYGSLEGLGKESHEEVDALVRDVTPEIVAEYRLKP
ncbi:hypothetical protein [Streptomyces koelreuteriae]|uniref:hypothetical protein n=1 Tax=Streptomyces koelreuteriae TaxID=2838015 RepID=UPI003EB8857D